MLQYYEPAVRRLSGLVLVAFMLPLLSVAESKLAISPTNPRQLSNSTLQFTALLNGKAAKAAPVQWSSSNPAVATIDGAGNAALLNSGATTITASLGSGSQQASTVLTVTTA